MNAIASAYGWSLAEILSLPIDQALVFCIAMDEGRGNKPRGMTFTERDIVAMGLDF